MKSKVLIGVIVIILIIIGAVIYSRVINKQQIESKNISASSSAPFVINFGFELWPGFMLITLADKLGYFHDEGILVNSAPYDDSDLLESDFMNEVINGRTGYASAVVDLAVKIGNTEQIIIVSDYSIGGDALVARDYAKPIRKVTKPKIAYVGNIDFFLYWIIRKTNNDPSNVEFVEYDSEEDSLLAFKNGEIDYLFTYDPYLSEAVASGGVVEYSSKDAPGIVADVFTLNKKFIESNSKEVEAFTRAYFKAYEYWSINKTKSYELVGPVFELTADELDEQMGKIKMLDLRDNDNAMEMHAGLDSLYGNLRLITMFMSEIDEKYMIDKDYDLIYTRAVRNIYNANSTK